MIAEVTDGVYDTSITLVSRVVTIRGITNNVTVNARPGCCDPRHTIITGGILVFRHIRLISSQNPLLTAINSSLFVDDVEMDSDGMRVINSTLEWNNVRVSGGGGRWECTVSGWEKSVVRVAECDFEFPMYFVVRGGSMLDLHDTAYHDAGSGMLIAR